MGMLDDARQQAEKAAKDHPERVEKASDEALSRGGDAADRVTDGKYADQVDKAERAGDEKVGD